MNHVLFSKTVFLLSATALLRPSAGIAAMPAKADSIPLEENEPAFWLKIAVGQGSADISGREFDGVRDNETNSVTNFDIAIEPTSSVDRLRVGYGMKYLHGSTHASGNFGRRYHRDDRFLGLYCTLHSRLFGLLLGGYRNLGKSDYESRNTQFKLDLQMRIGHEDGWQMLAGTWPSTFASHNTLDQFYAGFRKGKRLKPPSSPLLHYGFGLTYTGLRVNTMMLRAEFGLIGRHFGAQVHLGYAGSIEMGMGAVLRLGLRHRP